MSGQTEVSSVSQLTFLGRLVDEFGHSELLADVTDEG